MLKIAWGITGCGDQIEETFAIMKDLSERYDLDIKVYLSKNGELVMKWYNLWKDLKELFSKVSVEHGAKFDLFLVCPMSANTAAKIAHGIADSLLTNGVAQAAKAKIPIYIYPADQYEGAVNTILPDGKELTLYMRDVDIENADRLKRMQEITVLESIREIEGVVKGHIDGI
jgi:archaeoflavoprotein AfpA